MTALSGRRRVHLGVPLPLAPYWLMMIPTGQPFMNALGALPGPVGMVLLTRNSGTKSCHWYQIVYVYGVHPYAAHRAFLAIAEYQDIIKEMGCGPDKDEPGHDLNVGYGRVCLYPVPELNIFMRHGALHVWPAEDGRR